MVNALPGDFDSQHHYNRNTQVSDLFFRIGWLQDIISEPGNNVQWENYCCALIGLYTYCNLNSVMVMVFYSIRPLRLSSISPLPSVLSMCNPWCYASGNITECMSDEWCSKVPSEILYVSLLYHCVSLMCILLYSYSKKNYGVIVWYEDPLSQLQHIWVNLLEFNLEHPYQFPFKQPQLFSFSQYVHGLYPYSCHQHAWPGVCHLIKLVKNLIPQSKVTAWLYHCGCSSRVAPQEVIFLKKHAYALPFVC